MCGLTNVNKNCLRKEHKNFTIETESAKFRGRCCELCHKQGQASQGIPSFVRPGRGPVRYTYAWFMGLIILKKERQRSCSVVSNSLRPHGLQPTRLHSPWNSPGKNTGVGCHFLLQGIFPTQGLNPGLPHSRQTLYQLSHQGSLIILNSNLNLIPSISSLKQRIFSKGTNWKQLKKI